MPREDSEELGLENGCTSEEGLEESSEELSLTPTRTGTNGAGSGSGELSMARKRGTESA